MPAWPVPESRQPAVKRAHPLRSAAVLWCLAPLAAVLGFELLHPGHHVHGDGENRLHHHHFFLGDHGHADHDDAPHADRHDHADTGRHVSHQRGGEREDSEHGPRTSTALIADGWYSEPACFDAAPAVFRALEGEAALPGPAPMPRAGPWRPHGARGPPTDAFAC